MSRKAALMTIAIVLATIWAVNNVDALDPIRQLVKL